MKNRFLPAVIVASIFLGITLSAVPFRDFYFDEAMKQFTFAEDTVDDRAFKTALGDAIHNFETSFLFNKFSLFNHAKLSETQYRLGMCYLYLRNYKLAHVYFEAAKKSFSPPLDEYTDESQLDEKIRGTLVRVEGNLGQGRALVNQNIVRAGDLIGDIEVVEVTEHYVVFKKGDETFSDSIDKYNPLAKKERKKCWNYFNQARATDNIRFKRDYYLLAKKHSQVMMQNFSLDREQTEELNSVLAEAEQQVARGDRELAEALARGMVIAGMTGRDVENLLGAPLEKNRTIERDADERWIYENTVLFFKMDPVTGDKRILVDWEDKK